MEYEYEPPKSPRKGCLFAVVALAVGVVMVFAWDGISHRFFPSMQRSTIPTITEGVSLKPLPPPPPAAESLFREGLDAEERQAWDEAAKKFQAAGEGGMPRGWHRLGLLQMDGKLGKKDHEAAALTFATAFRASNGILAESAWKLAWLYEQGLGVQKDTDLSKQIRDHVLGLTHQEIAEPETRDFIATLWEDGKAGKRDLVRAFDLRAWGNTKDEKALLLLNRACQEGSPGAQFRMGDAFHAGHFGLAKDNEKALEWFEKAAEQMLPEAMLRVAEWYDRGIGAEKSPEKAVQWHRAAVGVAAPSPEAWVLWGQRLLEGRGVPQDRKEAFACFEKAEALAPGSAALPLALCYAKGWGTGRDNLAAGKLYSECRSFDQAKPLLLKAIQEGKTEAMLILAEANANAGRHRSAEAVLKEALKQDVQGADLALGKLYLRAGMKFEEPIDDEGIEAGIQKAERHLFKAMGKGSSEAAVLLSENERLKPEISTEASQDNPAGIPKALVLASISGNVAATIECAKWSLRLKELNRSECSKWIGALARLLAGPGSRLDDQTSDAVFGTWGDILLSSNGGPPDPIGARRAFQTGAKFGGMSSWHGLSRIYKEGLGVPADAVRAMYCEGRARFKEMSVSEGC